MSRYIKVSIDVADVLENLSETELEDLANELIADGYGTAPAQQDTLNIDDPVVRLQAIVELRRLGYSVEPTTGGAR